MAVVGIPPGLSFFDILPDEIVGHILEACDCPTWEVMHASCHRFHQIAKINRNIDIVASKVFENPLIYTSGLLQGRLLRNRTIAICALTKRPELIRSPALPIEFNSDPEMLQTAYVSAFFLRRADLESSLLGEDPMLPVMKEDLIRMGEDDRENISVELATLLPFQLHSPIFSPDTLEGMHYRFKKVFSVARAFFLKNPEFFSQFDLSIRAHKRFVLEALHTSSKIYEHIERGLQRDSDVKRAYELAKVREAEQYPDLEVACALEGDFTVRAKR